MLTADTARDADFKHAQRLRVHGALTAHGVEESAECEEFLVSARSCRCRVLYPELGVDLAGTGECGAFDRAQAVLHAEAVFELYVAVGCGANVLSRGTLRALRARS